MNVENKIEAMIEKKKKKIENLEDQIRVLEMKLNPGPKRKSRKAVSADWANEHDKMAYVRSFRGGSFRGL